MVIIKPKPAALWYRRMKQTMQQQFAEKVKNIVSKDETVLGLAVAGSWLSNEVDEWSDLDLILVTKEKVSGKEAMLAYARQYGHFLSGFTGDHVGVPNLLICLYDNPLLHVDIKFVTLSEFAIGRIETPVVLYDTDGQLQQALDSTTHQFPYPDYQWIEDRFWIWVHYILLKIGRGEYFEVLDALSFLRLTVLGPLLHIKNGSLPRGVRKLEMKLPAADLEALKMTVALPQRPLLLAALQKAIELYNHLRKALYGNTIQLQQETEKQVMLFFETITQESNTDNFRP